MPRKDQVATFGYYEIEDIPDRVDNTDLNELRRLRSAKRSDDKEYKRLKSKGLSEVQAYTAAYGKLVCPRWILPKPQART